MYQNKIMLINLIMWSQNGTVTRLKQKIILIVYVKHNLELKYKEGQ